MSPLPFPGDLSFLNAPDVTALFEALEREGDEVRAVGGAVRDALLGRPIHDIDFATTATPDVVVRRAIDGGFRVVPTGIDHGTVTLVRNGHSFEVTTLREDVETDGRHAVVRYGRDWRADAARRDFTINAISIGRDGTVHDPVGGIGDLAPRRIRFIGSAAQRIAEDRLRVLRFFRFRAELSGGEPDPEAYAAAIAARRDLHTLAAERIAHELRRLVVAPGAVRIATEMQDGGILPLLLGGVGYPAQLRRIGAFEEAAGLPASITRRLAALACRITEDAERVAVRLRLTNAERDGMIKGLRLAEAMVTVPDPDEARAIRYRHGGAVFTDGMALAAAMPGRVIDAFVERHDQAIRAPIPVFPISGRDLVAAGLPPGPMIGALLGQIEAWWIGRSFLPDRAILLERLQQIIASQQ